MGRRKQGRKQKRKSRATEAATADKYTLYQESVQEPEADVRLAQRIFEKRFGRPPRLLREDFCGAAALVCEWVRHHRECRAWGIDIDPEPLQWGHEHNLALLTAEQQKRVELIRGDVMEVPQSPLVDVTAAFNFSFFLFQKRSELLAYFRQARSTLRDEGILILDAYGGADAQKTMTETREHDGFDYVWDQDLYDPITNRVKNYIHFEFSDGSEMKRAFSYDWRLWSIPEMRDLLDEAGFAETEVYWEATDHKTGEGNGNYYKAETALDDPAWVAYLVAVR